MLKHFFLSSSLTKQLTTKYFIKTISQLCDVDNVTKIFKIKF